MKPMDQVVMQNIKILGAMHNAGIPLELAGLFGAKRLVKPTKPRELTDTDRERMAAAEAKRQRKAAKRAGK